MQLLKYITFLLILWNCAWTHIAFADCKAALLLDTLSIQRRPQYELPAKFIDLKEAPLGSAIYFSAGALSYIFPEFASGVSHAKWIPAQVISHSAEETLIEYEEDLIDGKPRRRISFGGGLSVSTVPDPENFSHFANGQYVILEKSIDVSRVDDEGNETVVTLPAPMIAQFVEIDPHNNTRYRVRVSHEDWSEPFIVSVWKYNVSATNFGSSEILRSKLQATLNYQPRFGKYEVVRYRDASGIMRNAQLLSHYGKKARLKSRTLGSLYVPLRSVFKATVFGEAATPIRFQSYSNVNVKAVSNSSTSSLMRFYLDAAAMIASRPAFLTLEPIEQIRGLVAFVQRTLPWTAACKTAENFGILSMEQILEMGAGVCRDLAPLLGFVLAETGLDVSVIVHYSDDRDDDGKRMGHAWIQARHLSAMGAQTYVIDPSASVPYVVPFDEAVTRARQDVNSMEAKWYTQPRRVTYDAVLPR